MKTTRAARVSHSLFLLSLAWAGCNPESKGSSSPANVSNVANVTPDTPTAPDTPTSKEAAISAPSSSAKRSGSDALTVELEGQRVLAAHAFVKREPGDKLQFYIGEGGSCSELQINLFDGKNQYLLVDVLSRLAADGKETFAVGDIYQGPNSWSKQESAISVRGNPGARGAKLDVDLALTAKSDEGHTIVVKGPLVAESCGDQDTSQGPLPKAQHASSAKMTIANKKIPIRAALRYGTRIELSDFPRDCSAAWFIGARLLHADDHWLLDGSRFADEISGDGAGLTVKPGKTGKSADGSTVELQLSGTGKVGDYTVAIEGTIEALDCQ